jgi:hypothetical protein
MTMHEHDTDLIMALAEGALDPDRASSVEAELASCATCAEDLALQRAALDFLSSAPPAAMNDIERARVRRAIRDELGLVPAAVPPSRARDARRYRLFAAMAGAAAVLIAFVVIAPSTNLLDLGGDDAGDDETVTFATDTTVAGDGRASLEERANALPPSEGGADVAAGPEAVATTAAPSTTAAPDTTGAPTTTASDTGVGYTVWSATELEELPDLTELAAALVEAKSIEVVIGPQDRDFDDRIAAAASDPRCVATGAASAPSAATGFVVGISGINDIEVMIVAYVSGDFDAVTVVAQDIETCKVLAQSG